MKEIKELRARAKRLEPAVRIGKNGLTENTLKEIDKVLVTRHLVKIKMLKTAFEKGEKEKIISDIVSSTDAELIDSVGNVFVIYRDI
ncbi:MAG TPA: YhbY family RNA-binding protein [Candidatus Nanoarchaeia archaeon]|nr:YhbY family RNA-binding protein [Candidatus Nanoarchaeia archaeon]